MVEEGAVDTVDFESGKYTFTLREGFTYELPEEQQQTQNLMNALLPAPSAPQGEGGAHDDGIANPGGGFQGAPHGLRDAGGDNGLADFRHGLLEELPVLGPGDGGGVRAQEADVLLLEEALLVQLHGQGQARLAPQARQEGVGLLLADDALHGLHGEGL